MKKRNKIIGVDFDGTLATISQPYPKIGEPIREVIDYIKKEQAKGAYIILVTMREDMALDWALAWCEDEGLKFDAVNDNLPHMKEWFKNNPRKIFCNEYLDDMNIGGLENILNQIKKKEE